MTSEIDYSATAWQESCWHFPLRDRPREELLLLQRHWMWANVQREAMGQEFDKEAESLEPGPLMMATKGVPRLRRSCRRDECEAWREARHDPRCGQASAEPISVRGS
jgi:hypothetical protein